MVSAIIANWNGAADLEISIPSLQAQSYDRLEILVVDNGSTDHSERVARNCGARWLPLERNFGLAPALNYGAAAAGGEFLLFLNNDMRFHPDFVGSLAAELEKDERTFAVDGLQYAWDGRREIHLATTLASRPDEGPGKIPATEIVPGLWVNQKVRGEAGVAFMASAANMMVRRSMFETLGGFDGRLPAGYEDTDLCWRAWLRGWKTVFAPQAVCWHRVGVASRSGEGARVRFRGTVGGRLLFATKLLPLEKSLATWAVTMLGAVRDLCGVRWSRVRDRGLVLLENLHYLPSLMEERRRLYAASSTTPRKHLRRLLALGQI